MSATTGSFSIGDSTVQMPVKAGTIGPSVVDIGKLYAQTGMFTYDPGFTSTASCESEITYIDGDQGVLLYRGYPIEQIAEHGDFLETCYLLLYGQLPTAVQKKDFDHRVTRQWCMSKWPGSSRASGVTRIRWPCWWRAWERSRPFITIRPIFRIPTSAWWRRFASSAKCRPSPRWRINIRSASPSFIQKMTSTIRRISCACASRCRARIIKSIRFLLARSIVFSFDHEQNPSTSTVRLAGSSGANPFACIAAGVACLWGPAHGGANEAAFKMLPAHGLWSSRLQEL
jgi:citrate synthase